MVGYWPWWLGAAALASVAVGFTASMKRSFGISGIYARLLNWREEREAEILVERQDEVRDAHAPRRGKGSARMPSNAPQKTE